MFTIRRDSIANVFRRSPRKRSRLAATLQMEPLEGRAVLATYTAANVADLISQIQLSNQSAEPTTINLVPNKTYTLTSAWNNTQNGLPNIQNRGDSNRLTINGNGASIVRAESAAPFRLLEVDGGAFSLNNATIRGGSLFLQGTNGGGGGLAVYDGDVTLTRVAIIGNSTNGSFNPSSYTGLPVGPEVHGAQFVATGGGIAVHGGHITLDQSTLQNNRAWQSGSGGLSRGGGLYNNGGSVIVTGGSLFYGNQAEGGIYGGDAQGGGLYSYDGTVSITQNSVFTLNTAIAGDGLPGRDGADAGNTSGSVGDDGGDAGVEGIGGPGGDAYGGGLYLDGPNSSLYVLESSFTNNGAVAGDGGEGGDGGSGGDGKAHNLWVFVVPYPGGDGGDGANGGIGGDAFGGAIYVNAGDAAIARSSIYNNSISGGAGGAFGSGGSGGEGGHASISSDGEVDGDSGDLGSSGESSGYGGSVLGGGIFNNARTTIENSTIAFNQARAGLSNDASKDAGSASGGGVYNQSGNLTLTHATIAFNSTGFQPYREARYRNPSYPDAVQRGGGLYNDSALGSVTIANSLIAENKQGRDDADIYGTIVSRGHNLVGIADAFVQGLISSDLHGSASTKLDPRLLPITEATPVPTRPQTLPLMRISPAVDAGDVALSANLETDQRGSRRHAGRVDIGAYEYIAESRLASVAATAIKRGEATIKATLTDQTQAPIAGQTVTFTINGAVVGAAVTNAQGIATLTASMPTLAVGSFANAVTASVAENGYVNAASARGELTVAAYGAPTTIAVTDAKMKRQSVTLGATTSGLFQATVTDAYGNPVPNVSVTFTAPPDSGRFGNALSATVSTDANGIAKAPAFTVGAKAGYYVVSAKYAGGNSDNRLDFPIDAIANSNTFDSITVQNGGAGRSFVNRVTLNFRRSDGLDVIANSLRDSAASRIKLTYQGLDGTKTTAVPLKDVGVSVSGNAITLDFGARGITGSATTKDGDGYYQISVDARGENEFRAKTFYRLLGDVNGDRQVDDNDLAIIAAAVNQPTAGLQADVDGDGAVKGLDLDRATGSKGRRLLGSLILDA